MPSYVLPDLDYDFAALEPHLSGRIVELHHGAHHKSYVDQANAALERLAEARERRDFSRLPALERALAFNVSGHVLHSIYWKNLAPHGGGEPAGEFARLIERDFGGFAALKAQLNEAAATVAGSGWALLAWEPVARRLVTLQVHDHQSEVTQSAVVLLALDAWEHAYYLQYQNRKAGYLDAIWRLWNWDDVSGRLRAAQALDLHIAGTAGEPVAARSS